MSAAVLPRDHISRLTTVNGYADSDVGDEKEELKSHGATRRKGNIEKQTANIK